MKATRVFQITALLLVVVSVVQVGWWVLDQRMYATAKTEQTRALYEQHVNAAREMLAAGIPAEQVIKTLPGVEIDNGRVAVASSYEAALTHELDARVNQYMWESAFFLLALGVCIAVIARALRAEALVLQEQDNFLALVSHQFKTPLASLQLSLETMTIRTLSPPQMRTLIDRMLGDLGRMESMVSHILDSVRLERGNLNLRREPLHLAAVVTRVVSQFEERARNQGVEISADVPRELVVLADPMSVDVVVRNLVENAIAAVAPVGRGSIQLTAQQQGGEVELAIRDSGVGFKQEDEPRLFQKFSRLHPGGGSSYHGTGLGLFIVKRLMQLAGGRVRAQSAGVGQGAMFVLAWPVAPTELQ